MKTKVDEVSPCPSTATWLIRSVRVRHYQGPVRSLFLESGTLMRMNAHTYGPLAYSLTVPLYTAAQSTFIFAVCLLYPPHRAILRSATLDLMRGNSWFSDVVDQHDIGLNQQFYT